MLNGWARYVKECTAAAKQHEIAAQSGIAPSVISRWLSAQAARPSAAQAIKLARAYKRPPGEALVAAGYLTADEAGLAPSEQRAAEDYSNEELVAALERFYFAAAAPMSEIVGRFLGRPVHISPPLGRKDLNPGRRKTDPANIEALSNAELVAATTDLVNDRARLMDELFRRLLKPDS